MGGPPAEEEEEGAEDEEGGPPAGMGVTEGGPAEEGEGVVTGEGVATGGPPLDTPTTTCALGLGEDAFFLVVALFFELFLAFIFLVAAAFVAVVDL